MRINDGEARVVLDARDRHARMVDLVEDKLDASE